MDIHLFFTHAHFAVNEDTSFHLKFGRKFNKSTCFSHNVWHTWHGFYVPPILEKVIGSKRLGCNTDHQEFGRCQTRG